MQGKPRSRDKDRNSEVSCSRRREGEGILSSSRATCAENISAWPHSSIVAPPFGEAKGSTTRRAVSSSVPTSPATFAEIIRRADEILRRPESGNPGRSVKPIRVGKPRSVGKTNTGRETQDGRQPRTSGCNPPFQAEEQYPDLQVRRSRPTSMTDSYFTKSEIYWSQGNKERFRNKKEKARKDNTNNNGTFWNLTWISRSDRPKRK
ncbi:hypothetical protein U1Q18_039642 [Sarracenia purpurea var. burkii]